MTTANGSKGLSSRFFVLSGMPYSPVGWSGRTEEYGSIFTGTPNTFGFFFGSAGLPKFDLLSSLMPPVYPGGLPPASWHSPAGNLGPGRDGAILQGMCGRVTVRTSPDQLVAELGLAGIRSAVDRPRYNLCPTQQMPVVTNDGARMLDTFRWGLIPSWAKDPSIGSKLINARGETVAEKPSFRTALKKRRCLVLVDGWYEWKQSTKPKTPYHFHRKDGRALALAGLWEEWTAPDTGEVLSTCTIITTGPNTLMAPIHDRMPVILSPQGQDVWLRPEPQEPAVLLPLLVPFGEDALDAYEVARVVNSPSNDVPACVERVAA